MAIGLPEAGVWNQIAAVVAALLGALLLTWTEKRAAQHQEALIGVLFVLASCVGIVLLASNPHGGEQLRDLLVGQILWGTNKQLAVLAVVTAMLLGAIHGGFATRLGRFGFYAVFAVAVTASVQLVGVYLVFSSLIVPGLALKLAGSTNRAAAYTIGVIGYALGLALSAVFDLPSGAIVVCTLAAIGLAYAAAAKDAGARPSPG
jgi:zinc/manganese transport system permease protein